MHQNRSEVRGKAPPTKTNKRDYLTHASFPPAAAPSRDARPQQPPSVECLTFTFILEQQSQQRKSGERPPTVLFDVCGGDRASSGNIKKASSIRNAARLHYGCRLALFMRPNPFVIHRDEGARHCGPRACTHSELLKPYLARQRSLEGKRDICQVAGSSRSCLAERQNGRRRQVLIYPDPECFRIQVEHK